MAENFDRSIYDEMDNFCAEILEGDKFINYINTENEYFQNPEETLKKIFSEDFKEGTNNGYTFEDFQENVKVFGDFYYYYLQKYSGCYTYHFNSKGYTKGFMELLKRNGIDPTTLDIKWDDIEKKEDKYQESLVDILYAMIEYELKKLGFIIFGLNLGYESVLYYVVNEEKYNRITNNQKMFKMFNLEFLETIYDEIYEVIGDLGVTKVEIGDFLEKREDGYHTLFANNDNNVIIEEINENDEDLLKIIL